MPVETFEFFSYPLNNLRKGSMELDANSVFSAPVNGYSLAGNVSGDLSFNIHVLPDRIRLTRSDLMPIQVEVTKYEFGLGSLDKPRTVPIFARPLAALVFERGTQPGYWVPEGVEVLERNELIRFANLAGGIALAEQWNTRPTKKIKSWWLDHVLAGQD
ncbi:MAG TPA: hypothetical protein VH234_01000 [Candidatus Saccharimonadales bacterium]|jgi:hypothetical protein|nr:hypothetical protein [Candidatus Saccharimonadales bacterium]